MKYIISLKKNEKLELPDIEDKVKKARNTWDYIEVKFGDNYSRFIKIAFCKDQTYCIGYNFWNSEFTIRTNMMIKMYPRVVPSRLATYLTNWVNKLN